MKVEVSDRAFLLCFGSFCCSHPQSAIDYDEEEYYAEYDDEQLPSRSCYFFKHGAFTLEGRVKAS